MKKMKKQRIPFFHNKSIFTETFLMLTALSLVTVIAMFLFVNRIVTDSQRERILTLNINQLRRAGEDIDIRLEVMEENVSLLLNSSDCISLMVNPRQTGSKCMYRVVNALSGYVAENPLIKKSFLYLPTSDEVYDSSENYGLRESAADGAIIDEYLQTREQGRDGSEETVVRLLHTDGRMFVVGDFCVPNFIGAVFFEIDLTELEEIIRGQETEEAVGQYLIYDENDRLVVGDPKLHQASAEAGQESLDIDLARTQGYSDYKGHFLVYHSANSLLKYELYTEMDSQVSFFTIAWMVLPFILMYAVFSELYSLYITRSIYKPINRLMQITSESRADLDALEQRKGKNELDFLEMAFQDTLGENTQYKELLGNISHDLIEQMFRSVLSGKMVSNEYITHTLTGIGLSHYLNGRYMALAGRLIVSKEREPSEVEAGLYRRSLLSFLEEREKDGYISTSFFQEKEVLAVVLCFQEDASVIHMKHCVTQILNEVESFTAELPYSVVFGKGKVYNDIFSLRFSWQDAQEEVQYLCYLSEEPKSEGPDLDKMSDDYDKRYFSERGHQVAAAAEKNQRKDAEKMAFSMIREISECSPENRQMYLELVVDIIVEKMIDSHITSDEIKAMNLNQALEQVAGLTNPEKISNVMCDFFSQAIRAIHTSSRRNRYRYVESAKEYIEAHYSDGNLSLNEVSDAIGISSPYLSAIFTEVNQEGFSSYLSSYRVSQAKQYLEQTTQGVAEIGYKCGFNSAQSFSRVFKKVTGFTPGAYRENWKEQKRAELGKGE